MTDLDKLIAAVEAGVFPADTSASDLGLVGAYDGMPVIKTMYSAFTGSLDAAKRLHDALLPGWVWKRQVHPGPVASLGVWEPPKFVMGQSVFETDDNPARAWLLAILKALRAQQQ